MPISKQKKSEIFTNLEANLKGAESLVFVNFHGLKVAEITELRKALREAGVSYTVVKKTIAKKILEKSGYKGEIPTLSGELAIAYSADQIAPAREVNNFEKKFDKRVSILGGVFESAYKDRDGMKVIASIPSREVLLSQIAFLLKSPLQRLAIAVSEVAKKK